MEEEEEDKKKNEEVQQQSKETFEPLEMKVVDVKVETGYATSGHADPITINEWKTGNW